MHEPEWEREQRAAKRKDVAAVIFGVLVILAVVVLVPLSIWARVWGPCEYVDWLPVAEVPSRCLTVGER